MIAKAKGSSLFLLALLFQVRLSAESVKLVWDPSPSPAAAGYLVYCSPPDPAGMIVYDVGNLTNAVIENLVGGQTYTFYATAYDSDGQQSGPSNTLVYFVPKSNPAGASFVKIDATTGGDWRPAYGVDGYWISSQSARIPAYVTVVPVNASGWVWNPDARQLAAPYVSRLSTNKVAACWYSASQLSFDISISDGKPHRIAAYCWDLYSTGRQQRFEIVDRSTGVILDSRFLSGFTDGSYVVWDIQGSIQLRVTPYNSVNGVITALFFDPSISSFPQTTAMFVKSDTTTVGNWTNVYGFEGNWVCGVSPNLPPYARVAPVQTPQWLWSQVSTRPTAPLLPDSSGSRIEACWYSSTKLGLDVSFTDGKPHRIAAYFLDLYSAGRNQRIDIINVETGEVLDSRMLTNFQNGVYLVWNVTGAVGIRASPSNINAVASALFFDASQI